MTADSWANAHIMPYSEVKDLVEQQAKARHEHHAGITLFGWAINIGIYKTNDHYKPQRKLWWN